MKPLVSTFSIKTMAFAMCMCLVGVAFGQNDSKKRQSRLEIGQKKEEITLTSKLQLIAKPIFKPGEIRYSNSSTVYNQYIKSKLLNAETKPIKSLPKSEVTAGSTDRSDKLFHADDISVSTAFPNPATDNTTLDYSISASVSNAKIIVRNLFGTPIATYILDNQERKLVIPTEQLASGVYTYQLIVDGQLKNSKKLLVRHQ